MAADSIGNLSIYVGMDTSGIASGVKQAQVELARFTSTTDRQMSRLRDRSAGHLRTFQEQMIGAGVVQMASRVRKDMAARGGMLTDVQGGGSGAMLRDTATGALLGGVGRGMGLRRLASGVAAGAAVYSTVTAIMQESGATGEINRYFGNLMHGLGNLLRSTGLTSLLEKVNDDFERRAGIVRIPRAVTEAEKALGGLAQQTEEIGRLAAGIDTSGRGRVRWHTRESLLRAFEDPNHRVGLDSEIVAQMDEVLEMQAMGGRNAPQREEIGQTKDAIIAAALSRQEAVRDTKVNEALATLGKGSLSIKQQIREAKYEFATGKSYPNWMEKVQTLKQQVESARGDFYSPEIQNRVRALRKEGEEWERLKPNIKAVAGYQEKLNDLRREASAIRLREDAQVIHLREIGDKAKADKLSEALRQVRVAGAERQAQDIELGTRSLVTGIDRRILEAERDTRDPRAVKQLQDAIRGEKAAVWERAAETPMDEFKRRIGELRGLKMTDKARKNAVGQIFSETLGRMRLPSLEPARLATVGSAEAFRSVAAMQSAREGMGSRMAFINKAGEVVQREVPGIKTTLLDILKEFRGKDVVKVVD